MLGTIWQQLEKGQGCYASHNAVFRNLRFNLELRRPYQLTS